MGGEVPGQTRNHARLLNLLGIKQLIVGINKMDSSVDGETYSEKRFIEIATEVKRILLQEGWKKEQIEKEIPILPLAGFHGENLLKKSEKMPWWKGVTVFDPTTKKEIQVNCLLDALNDMVNLPTHTPSNPRVGKVFSIEMHHREHEKAGPGDNVGVSMKGLPKGNMPRDGDIMVKKSDTEFK